MEYQDFRLAQNAFSLEIDEQLFDVIQLDDIASKTGDGHGHTTHGVKISSDIVGFSKPADLSCDTVGRGLRHWEVLHYSQIYFFLHRKPQIRVEGEALCFWRFKISRYRRNAVHLRKTMGPWRGDLSPLDCAAVPKTVRAQPGTLCWLG